jgi:hypothetical protein
LPESEVERRDALVKELEELRAQVAELEARDAENERLVATFRVARRAIAR